MRAATASYRRTVIASFAAGLAVIAATSAGHILGSRLLPGPIVIVLAALGWIVGVLLLLIALSGLLVISRHARRERGEPDLFNALNGSRSEAGLLDRTARTGAVPFSALRRWVGAPAFVVGDPVRVRSLREIAATLDASGRLDGLPFMPEMAQYCGRAGTVFRCVDKVYDYGGKKDLRRLRDTVLVAGLRCDGHAHDGCQAGCHLLWKTAWLERADAPAASAVQPGAGDLGLKTGSPLGPTVLTASGVPDRKYRCQYTEIAKASTEISRSDPRQDLRPLIAGNVTAFAFVVAMLTRLFNAIQKRRGGMGYPPSQRSSGTTTERVDLDLKPGETVRVASKERIFGTLDKTGRNRGLWFDKEMLKYCGQSYRVLYRVEKIIDDATGQMHRMKTPCIVLEGVDSSGEHLRFCAQHDYPFWREAWLERTEAGARLDQSRRDDRRSHLLGQA